MTKKKDIINAKVKGYLLDLANSDEKKQLSAIKSLKTHGSEMVIQPLVDVLLHTNSEKVKSEIIELLNTTKSTKVPVFIALLLSDKKYKAVHEALLAAAWNSGLDYGPYLKNIVEATINGDFMAAMECITIIENLESGFGEDQLMESILILREYLVENKNVNDERMNLLKEILVIIQEMNELL